MKLSSQQLNQLDQLRQSHHLKLILLHGSQVDGQTHTHSDIDIAVYGRVQKVDSLALIRQLAEIFQSDKIDLVNLNIADPLLLKAVTDKARLIAGSDQDFMPSNSRLFIATTTTNHI
jgi:predicted nucleotidyltransferase